MAEDMKDIQKLSPDKLVGAFTRGRLAFYLIIAIIVHVVVIGATSIGYIRDTYIDPEGAARREQAAAEKAEAARQAKLDAAEKAANKSATKATTQPTTMPTASNATKNLGKGQDTETGKGITEVADPNEIPDSASDLPFRFEDTNP